MSAKTDEIYETVLPEMARLGIEDATQHRIWFLEGLRDGWKEDPTPTDSEVALQKALYMIAINGEIMILKFRLQMERLVMS